MAKNYRNSNRQRLTKQYGHLYTRKFRWLDSCVYCGESATCLDHVFPIAMCGIYAVSKQLLQKFKRAFCLVPSCEECNRLASNTLHYTILDKRLFIQDKLRKKYKKHNNSADWGEDEINELGRNLQQHVRKMLSTKTKLVRRLNWPLSR